MIVDGQQVSDHQIVTIFVNQEEILLQHVVH
jgi:hypothetical protein